ncbi:DUF1572 family protein [Virgibacillus siamensis]|uniref:DUF1572 family protein n=1 Tax=Virgibacillus siamensis TaxID=480071 RepID=UPI001FE8328E|nr:DUF1572 family protein [Virgibacillus siamensis]
MSVYDTLFLMLSFGTLLVYILTKNKKTHGTKRPMKLEKTYLHVIIKKFKDMKKQGDKTINRLSEEEIHWAYNDASNSVAVIVKHLNGNMVSRWTDFLNSDGEKPYRNRDNEFEDDQTSKQELIFAWEKGWETLFSALDSLKEEDIMKRIYIRGEEHTVLEAIERQLAHYASHVGQIIYIGKQVKGESWESLSIPKGKSQKYLEDMLKKHERE